MTGGTGQLTAEDLGTVHLIGVGGVGMSGLARLLLTRGIPFQDLGFQYFDDRVRPALERRLVRRLEALGNSVVVTPVAPQPVAA